MKKSNGQTVHKSRPLISGRHFMTAIDQKYADESSLASGNVMATDESSVASNAASRASVSTFQAPQNDNRKQITPCQFVVSGSRAKRIQTFSKGGSVLESGVAKN